MFYNELIVVAFPVNHKLDDNEHKSCEDFKIVLSLCFWIISALIVYSELFEVHFCHC